MFGAINCIGSTQGLGEPVPRDIEGVRGIGRTTVFQRFLTAGPEPTRCAAILEALELAHVAVSARLDAGAEIDKER
jgi:hypothetical protein